MSTIFTPLRDWFLGLGAVVRWSIVTVAAVFVLALGVFVWFAATPGPMDFAGGETVALADYHGGDPTGVPASLKNASLVERGAYLARAADCMVCHTQKGGTQYSGGLAFTLTIGTIYSTNITPDQETGIGNYSDAQFLAAVRQGVRADGARLYPAMPYASYTFLTDEDALAIKAYLFSLAPVHAPGKPATLSFPFNQRWAMAVWSWMFNPSERFEPNTAQSAEWNRGAYLVEALTHCGECHTPRNVAFALSNGRKFAGERQAGWLAYNISGDQGTGIGAWTNDDILAYLKVGHVDGHGTASGPMGEAVDYSFSQLTPEDLHAIVAYVRSVPATSSRDVPSALAAEASPSHRQGPDASNERGKKIFEGACVSCHGWSGVSPILPYATLTGARAVNDPSATNVAQIIISGTKRMTAQGVVAMPAFGRTLSDIEVAAVANYVTARFGSQPSAISEGDVAQLRREVAR